MNAKTERAKRDGIKDGSWTACRHNILEEYSRENGEETPAGDLMVNMGRDWFEAEYSPDGEDVYNEAYIHAFDEQVIINQKSERARYEND